ncbi:MAG: hypothetical protein BM485_04625 [Desulfobulbaceae bacterium DB1]|nr:MAG: hypothetical protein BM485_04625 [Desulfobulbaceae bacterium DB1]
MQVNNKPSNIPFKTPAEVDGQNRLQTRQAAAGQTQQTQILASGDKLSISGEAKALSNNQNAAYDATTPARNQTQVRARTNAADVADNSSNTAAQLRTAQEQTMRMNQPPAPPEQPSETAASRPEPTSNGQTAPSAPPNTLAPSAPESTAPATATQRPEPAAPPIQTLPPQSMNTAQKAAQESPISAAGGMAAGPYNINLTV